MLRKELLDLTDEDIDWLCGLTEAAEAWEPVSVKSSGNFITPTVRAQPSSKRRRGGTGTAATRALESTVGALPQTTSTDTIGSGRKRRPVTLSHPSRRSPRLHSGQSAPMSPGKSGPESDTQTDQAVGQPLPPSQLAASQRPFRIQLSRARRRLHGDSSEKGSLYFLQMLTAFLQFIGKQYPATEQDRSSFLKLMT